MLRSPKTGFVPTHPRTPQHNPTEGICSWVARFAFPGGSEVPASLGVPPTFTLEPESDTFLTHATANQCELANTSEATKPSKSCVFRLKPLVSVVP